MKTKIKEILGSVRFWLLVTTAITAILGAIVSGEINAEFIFNTLQALFIGVAGIGTLDSIAEKAGNKK